jgi:hypothetical protein
MCEATHIGLLPASVAASDAPRVVRFVPRHGAIASSVPDPVLVIHCSPSSFS